MKENKFNSLASISQIIAKNAASPLMFKDSEEANDILMDLNAEPDIQNATIFDVSNKHFADYSKDKNFDFESVLANKKSQIITKNSMFYKIPVYENKEFLGTVCIKASFNSLNEQLMQKIKITLLIILASILISFIFASVFQNYISTPILKLVNLMEKVGKTKNFSLRSEIKTKDEIGKLSNEFNELLSQVEKHDDSLTELNFQLEEKVQERTQELEKKNKNLAEAKLIAEKSKQVKEQFLASMSHEIRTPLNAILGFQELLKTTELSDEQKEYINSIDFAGRNLLVIINDVLDISKIEAGKFIFEEVELNMNEVLKSVVELVDFRAKEKNLSLSYSINSDLSAVLYGDSARLTQILLNLIGNAIKFTEKGGISVQLDKIDENDLYVKILFQVIDTGIGLSGENLNSVFESFTQASSETNRKYGGTGLGLTIVKQLVELQGGEISVESELGKGSTFSFRLSFKKGNSNTNYRKNELNTSGFDFILRQKSILLVEDMLLNQNLIKKIMNKWEVNLEIANNGIEALEKLKSSKYDLILMDIQMPEMDGYETTQHIRNSENEGVKNIPIVALTAHASSSEAEKCLNLGMNAYLAKPFKTELLKNQILNLLNTANKKQQIQVKKEYDLSYLVEHADGDLEFLKDMIQIFLNDTPKILEELKISIDEGDFEKIKFNSHSMKGGFLTLGITEAGELIREIEILADQKNNLDLIINHYSKIEKLFNSSKPLLEKELIDL